MTSVRFGHALAVTVVLAAVHLEAIPGSARASEPTSAVDRFDSGLDAWPVFHLALGALYAPAPQAHGYRQGAFVSENLLDQGGIRLAADIRLIDFALLGAVVDYCNNSGSSILDLGLRGGAQFALGPTWALYALLSVGVSMFGSNSNDHLFRQGISPEEREYFGWGAGGTLGVRIRPHPRIGLFFELTGAASRYRVSGSSSEREDFENPYLARLQLSAGVTIGLAGRSEQSAPGLDRSE
jgi:hypothetical protein